MDWPEFALKNVPRVLGFPYEAEESALGFLAGSAGADATQPPPGSDARIEEWARAAGRCVEEGTFGERLEGRQVESELSAIFRETPEFGRSLAERLADFHDSRSSGPLTLIGGGGEAVVFFDQERQEAVKLLGGAGRAGFGWHAGRDSEGRWTLRAGKVAESLMRFFVAERHFPTGLDLDSVGKDGQFLILKQPFFVGENPEDAALAAWMNERGWQRHSPPSELTMLRTQTWKKGLIVATDVRPENAILAEADGQIYSFDFIVAWERGQ